MRLTKIVQIAALVFAANAMALAALHHQSSTAKPIGQLGGTVVDTNEARVAGATVTVEGGGITRAVTTAEDGTYKIELPTGSYRIRVNSRGFCPVRRAPFRVQPSTAVMLNFILTACPIVNNITIVNGQYAGETDHYQDPFKEEAVVPEMRQTVKDRLRLKTARTRWAADSPELNAVASGVSDRLCKRQ